MTGDLELERADLADRWGVTGSMAGQVVDREGFPDPVRRYRRGRVWRERDVAGWEAAERAAGRLLPGERRRKR